MFVFALYSIILSIKMLRSPLFPNHAFNFIFYSLEAHLMNAPETTLVCVGAMKLKRNKNKKKKNRQSRFVPASLAPFIFLHLSWTNVNNHNMH